MSYWCDDRALALGQRHLDEQQASAVRMMKHQRYSSAGLAGSAADTVSEATGEAWVMKFRPRSRGDRTPFVIERA